MVNHQKYSQKMDMLLMEELHYFLPGVREKRLPHQIKVESMWLVEGYFGQLLI